MKLWLLGSRLDVESFLLAVTKNVSVNISKLLWLELRGARHLESFFCRNHASLSHTMSMQIS